MDLQDISSFRDIDDIAIKLRNRWYVAGTRAKKRRLTVAIYQNGKTERAIGGKTISLHQTEKALEVAEKEGTGIYIYDELVAVWSHENVLHILTDDRNIIQDILDPVLEQWSDEDCQIELSDWMEFIQSAADAKIKKEKDQLQHLDEKIDLNEMSINQIEQKIKQSEEASKEDVINQWRDVQSFMEDVSVSGLYLNLDEFHHIHIPGDGPPEDRDFEAWFTTIVERGWKSVETFLKKQAQRLAQYKRDLRAKKNERLETRKRLEKIENLSCDKEQASKDLRVLDQLDGYESVSLDGKKVIAITEPITLEWKDYEYPMGQFAVIVSHYDENGHAWVRVRSHKDNYKVGRLYHPHVSSGKLCTGNMKQAFIKASETNNVIELLMIAKMILFHFNEADPYAQITKWPKKEE